MAVPPFRIDIIDDRTVRVVSVAQEVLEVFHQQLRADGLRSTLRQGEIQVEAYFAHVFASLLKCEL